MTIDLDAGRELDDAVARLVWPAGDWPGHEHGGPNLFSATSPNAMVLLDTLAERGWDWAISTNRDGADAERYYAGLWRGADPQEYQAAPTLPLAIVRAVLAALGEVRHD